MEYAGSFEVADTDVQPGSGRRFSPYRARVTLYEPAQKIAAELLGQCYPATMAATALVAAAAWRLGAPEEQVAPLVMHFLGNMVIAGLVRYRRTPAPTGACLGDFPRTSVDVRSAPALPMDRGPDAFVCNLWHEPINVSHRAHVAAFA